MISTLGREVSYTPNGTDTVFTFPHALINASDLVVTEDGVVVVAYTVSEPSDTGVTVTFTDPPTASSVLLLKRTTPTNQLVDYVANESFNADTHENALDKLTLIIQELGDDYVSFSTTDPLVYWEEDGTTLQPSIAGYNFGAASNRVGDAYFSGRINYGSTVGIVAGTTQTQAGGTVLTTDLNEIATVANANDAVTLPVALVGTSVTIFNNGANTLKIFPSSGDNLGAGVNVSSTLAAGNNISYVAYNTTNWEVVGREGGVGLDNWEEIGTTLQPIYGAGGNLGVAGRAVGDVVLDGKISLVDGSYPYNELVVIENDTGRPGITIYDDWASHANIITLRSVGNVGNLSLGAGSTAQVDLDGRQGLTLSTFEGRSLNINLWMYSGISELSLINFHSVHDVHSIGSAYEAGYTDSRRRLFYSSAATRTNYWMELRAENPVTVETPASGYGLLFIDNTDNILKHKDDTGTVTFLTGARGSTEFQDGLTTVGSVITLGTQETSVVASDVLGRVNFYAPLDAAGTDANLVAGSIVAQAEGTFSASSNATSLLFQTGASEVATTKMTLTSAGVLTTTGDVNGASPTEMSYLSGATSSLQTQITSVTSDLTTHEALTNNPHTVTQTQVGLGNVDNTTDLLKPLSTADIAALALKAPLASPSFTGNVGIGTAAPTAPLHVSANISSPASDLLTLQGTSWGDTEESRIRFARGSIALATIGTSAGGSGSRGDLVFSTAYASALTERMRIDYTGNVGIGTTTPDGKLHALKTGTFDPTLSGSSSVSSLIFENGDGTGTGLYNGINWFKRNSSTVNGAFVSAYNINVGLDTGLALGTHGATRMLIDEAGNVGIGTTTPTVALDVVGAVKISTTLQVGNTAVAATPTATHTITVKDAAGTTYRLLCVV